MSHVTGVLLIDAPASALNNAGEDTEIRAENAVAVKFIPDCRGTLSVCKRTGASVLAANSACAAERVDTIADLS